MTDNELLVLIKREEGGTPDDFGVPRERLDALVANGVLRCIEDEAFPENNNPFYAPL